MGSEGSTPPPRAQPATAAGGEASPRSPESAGGYLRGLRTARGASLDDIARATRVGRRHLEALEADESAELPAPVFVKGFIRAYCEFLEARPDEALERYRRQAEHATPAPRSGGGMRGPRGAPSRLGSPIAVSLLLLVVLSGALIAVNLGLRSGGPPAPTTPAPPAARPARQAEAQPPVEPSPPRPPVASAAPARAPEPAPAPPSVQPQATAATTTPVAPTGAAGAAPAPDRRQRLVVRALESTWVRVQVDRSRAVEELLPEGAVREWSAAQDFVLTVGNAGGVELTLNGQRLPPLGSRGAVIRELVLPQQASAPRS